MSWQCEVRALGSLLESAPQNGYSPICPRRPTGKWVLGLSALNGSGLDMSQAKPAPLADHLIDRFMLRPGDFLISRSNTLDKVGRIGVFRGELASCAYPDLMMRFRPNAEMVDPDYLEVFLRSELVVRFVQQHATGTSGSMKKINKNTVESIPVSLPPRREQPLVARLLRCWDFAIEKSERLIAAKERRRHELHRHGADRGGEGDHPRLEGCQPEADLQEERQQKGRGADAETKEERADHAEAEGRDGEE